MAKRLCELVLPLCALAALGVFTSYSAEAAVGRTAGHFSVSSNGAATATIPLYSPSGVRGLAPSLALTYNSNADVGYLGKGWSLGGAVSTSISRCRRTVSQDGFAQSAYLNTTDAYCLGGNRLRKQSGTYGTAGSTYFTEIADFSRITANGTVGNGPEFWTVERKDGLIYTYGGSSAARPLLGTSYSYNPYTVVEWMLSEIRDRAGNKVKFTWKTTDSTTTGTTHPTKIEWTQTSSGSGVYVTSMDFHYSAGGNAPASSPVRYLRGFARSDSDLLTSITVSAGGSLVRNTVLTYESSPTTTAKRLTQVKECSDSGATDCLSPTTLSYQDNTAGVNTASPSLSISGDVIAAEGKYDFNGDGILDIAYRQLNGTNYTWFVRFGSASSGYSSAVNTGIAGTARFGRLLNGRADQLLADSGGYWHVYAWNGSSFSATNTGLGAGTDVVVADVDADGLDDLSYVDTPGTQFIGRYYYPTLSLSVWRNTTTSGSLSFAAPVTVGEPYAWQPFESGYPSWWPPQYSWPVYAELSAYYGTEDWAWGFQITGATLTKGNNKNGDGRQALQLAVEMQWCNYPPQIPIGDLPGFCADTASTTELRLVEFGGSGPGLSASFSLQDPYTANTMVAADFNGDNCEDYDVYDSYSGRNVGLSDCGGTGGFFGSVLPSIWYGDYVGAADWTGDGNADFFQSDGSTVTMRSFQGGALSSAVSTGLPGGCLLIRTDGNGDGLDDIGCLQYSTSLTIYPHNGASLAPDLLASVVDGFGVTHTPTYTAIERSNYSAYNNAAYPARDVTRGRFVVKTVTASDGIGGTFDTTYSYFGAQVNVQGRGFAGFDKIETVDSRNGILRQEKFKREFPYSGMPYEVNVYQSVSGALMSQRAVTAAYTTLDTTNHNQRYFPYVSATAEEVYEVGGSQNGALIQQSATSNTYDAWGNLTAATSTVTDKDSTSPLYNQTWTTATTQVISTYDTTNWCLNLPTSTAVTSSSSVSGESTVYQSKGFSTDYYYCRHTGDTVGTGALQVDTSYGFDGFGNVSSVSVTGRHPNGTNMTTRTASISWGAANGSVGATGQFPVSETNALGQTSTRTFHATFGSLLTETDPNGIVLANNEFDAFGRATRSLRPDGTGTRITYAACATYGCENGDPGSSATGINKTVVVSSERDASDAQVRDSRTYLDLFGRPIVHKAMTVTGGYSRTGTEYDALGRTYRSTAPCDAGSCSAYWVTNAYDLMGRVATQSRPQSQSVSTAVTTTFTYAGRTQSITDPQNKVTTKVIHPNGQMRKSLDHDNYYQEFAYDAVGNLKTVTDALSNTLFTASYVYGVAPFQTATTDMDRGNWSYTFNSLGELTAWQDAKSQTFSQDYDALSRPLTRTETEGTTTWTYGTSAGSHNIGRLAGVSMSGYSEALTYDSIGRPSSRSITTDQTYAIDYAYTNQGLVDTVTYPVSTSSTRVKVKYGYAYGILTSVTDWTAGSAGTTYWTANAQNARGQITQQTLGNGVVTTKSFDAVTGWLSAIQSGVSGALQNQSYLYDLIGNITQRQENTQGLTENFYYDNLYRLTQSTLQSGSSTATNLTVAYNAMGNITQRSDVNGNASWSYHSTKKHAVTSTGSGGSAYSYDANGNMTSRAGSTISWSSFNAPVQLATATESTQLFYGPDRQYYKQVYTGPAGTETTHYVGGLLEKVVTSGGTDWRHSIRAAGQVVAIVSRKSTSANAVYYPLEDHQGSGSNLTDSSGASLVRQSYNAFGLPRDGADWDGAVSSTDKATINNISRRGYTGHSMLGDMGLIHMNGRVQDAITGRFLSPDPTTANPGNTQSFNRYAYVNNNPLRFIDPSGFTPEYFGEAAYSYMGGGLVTAEYATQLLEYCGQAAAESENGSGESFEYPQICVAIAPYYSDWLQGYSAHVMNGQMATAVAGLAEGQALAATGQSDYVTGSPNGTAAAGSPKKEDDLSEVAASGTRTDDPNFFVPMIRRGHAINPNQYAIATAYLRDVYPGQEAHNIDDERNGRERREYYGRMWLANGGVTEAVPLTINTMHYPPAPENRGVRELFNAHLHPRADNGSRLGSGDDVNTSRSMPVFYGNMAGAVFVLLPGMNSGGSGIKLCNTCILPGNK
jgi:RHS repeat-associated protein